jgi:hypothetical protein
MQNFPTPAPISSIFSESSSESHSAAVLATSIGVKNNRDAVRSFAGSKLSKLFSVKLAVEISVCEFLLNDQRRYKSMNL